MQGPSSAWAAKPVVIIQTPEGPPRPPGLSWGQARGPPAADLRCDAGATAPLWPILPPLGVGQGPLVSEPSSALLFGVWGGADTAVGGGNGSAASLRAPPPPPASGGGATASSSQGLRRRRHRALPLLETHVLEPGVCACVQPDRWPPPLWSRDPASGPVQLQPSA